MAQQTLANSQQFGFKRDDTLKCLVNKFMVLEMTLNHAYCVLVTLSVWSNIFEKDIKQLDVPLHLPYEYIDSGINSLQDTRRAFELLETQCLV